MKHAWYQQKFKYKQIYIHFELKHKCATKPKMDQTATVKLPQWYNQEKSEQALSWRNIKNYLQIDWNSERDGYYHKVLENAQMCAENTTRMVMGKAIQNSTLLQHCFYPSIGM